MKNFVTAHVSSVVAKLRKQVGDAGVGFILIIACSLIIAAFVLLPGLRTFAGGIITAMTSWWNTSIRPTIFPAS